GAWGGGGWCAVACAARVRAAGLRAGLRRLRARLLHDRRRPAAAAGADLLLDPVRHLTRDQRGGHPDAAGLGAADRGGAAAAAPVQPQVVQPGPDHRRRTPMTTPATPAETRAVVVPPAVSSAVSLRGLTKEFGGTRVVDRIDLDVAAGEFFSLLGPSGCGKTTTLRMIAGFNDPTSGTVLVGGEDVTRTPPHKRDVNTVFQSYALFEHLDVRGNVGFGLRRKGVDRSSIDQRGGRCLERVELGPRARPRPAQLPGAQRQRVALPRALITRPKVLLLDEPLAA